MSLFLLILLFFSPMQQTDWRLILYDFNERYVYTVSPQGVEAVNLPTVPYSVAASLDGQFLASMDENFMVHVANLENRTCCVSFAAPIERPATVYDYGVGAVSPDGTQVVLYIIAAESDSAPFYGEMFAVDAMTGQLIARQRVDELGSEGGVAPLFGLWTDRGVQIAPSCYACDGFASGPYLLWNPVTGEIGQDIEGLSLTGDTLELTGEIIQASRDTRFPLEMEGMLGPFNVIEYVSSDGNIPVLVYVEPGETNLPYPYWIADGQAVLLHSYEGTEATLLFRNGQTQTVQYNAQTRYLGSVPDGWVVANVETGEVLYYRIGASGALSLGTIPEPNNIFTVYELRQGASAEITFASSTVDPNVPFVCEGFLPLRLKVGEQGRVTPGAPNNLRAEPTTQSELIGQIPGSAVFTVWGGPVCTPGMAWWQVEYNGMLGWTGEGQGNTYWTEPVQ